MNRPDRAPGTGVRRIATHGLARKGQPRAMSGRMPAQLCPAAAGGPGTMPGSSVSKSNPEHSRGHHGASGNQNGQWSRPTLGSMDEVYNSHVSSWLELEPLFGR